MNTYSIRKPRSYDWTKAFLVSVAVHVFLVALWIGAIFLEVFTINAREFVEDVIAEDKYVTMPMEMVEAIQNAKPEPELAPKPQAPEKRFQPTRPNQETTEQVTSQRYFGERNTAAASEGEVMEEGLEVPSQDGREALTENDLELTSSDFADGDTTGAPGTPGEPLPLSPTALLNEPIPEAEMLESKPTEVTELMDEPVPETPVFEPTEPSEPTDEQRLEMAQAKAAELLAFNESIPVPKKEETPEPKEEVAPEEAIPEPKAQPQPTSMAGGVTGNRGLESGYDREASRTRMSGTIRRRGESSLEVEDSVKGRYFAQVNKEVEKAWQRECILRREHILPGVLSVSFSINETGKVTGFRFDSRIAGGAIQEGFTMRAIQKAKIPAMPPEIKNELEGDLLEMNLTFFF
ncbi:MAG: hypothetical protein ACSHYB_17715 [Roseibacillus sp.]